LQELTIKDVSTVAGVSIATVSRHINKTGKVADDTALKIDNAIEELNFRPNIVGRALRTGKTKSIGIVIPSISNPVFADALNGVQLVAKENNYITIITTTEYNSSNEEQVIQTLLSNGVDGLILTVSNEKNNKLLSKLDKEHIPYVLLYNKTDNKNRSFVSIDNKKASQDIAKTLIKLGHKKFGIIGLPIHISDRSLIRREAFSNCIKQNGLEKPFEIDATHNLENQLLELYQSKKYPTALFCSNDAIALHVIQVLRNLNIKVPDDVSVFGFDGIHLSNFINPILSTVMQPSTKMGEEAFKQLLKLITHDGAHQAIVLPYELRIAETTKQIKH
jgi:DNA-binding LacI/PurR family transcriptional regulator